MSHQLRIKIKVLRLVIILRSSSSTICKFIRIR